MIGSRMGGIVDLIDDGHTGILVAPEDHEGLLRGALRRLADDPQLATTMGARALERSGAFIASAVVPRIEEAYRSVIRANPVATA